MLAEIFQGESPYTPEEVATLQKIMLATVRILFMPESTEGVAEGATTAMGQEEYEESNK